MKVRLNNPELENRNKFGRYGDYELTRCDLTASGELAHTHFHEGPLYEAVAEDNKGNELRVFSTNANAIRLQLREWEVENIPTAVRTHNITAEL